MTRRVTIGLLLAPAMIILIVLFFGGFLLGIMQSMNYMPLIGLTEPNLDAYRTIFTDEQFSQSLILTFSISISATLLTVTLAIATAMALRHSFIGKRVVNFMYQFPITIPHLVIAIGTMFLFSQSGTFARLAFHAGIISDQSQFPQLVNDRFGLGIIYVYLWKQIPFVGIIVLAIMQSMGNNYEELARSLGANKWQTFRYILMPIIIPGILPASIICFAFTFGSYEVPFLLGRPYPAVLSILAYRLYDNVDLNARPQAMAMAVFMTVFLMLFVVAYKKLLKKASGRD
jgi:putative spermidine/putrescine transport system permease protein